MAGVYSSIEAYAKSLQAPPVPDITDTAVLMKQYERKRRLAALQGRTSTFLTGPRGLGGPPSEIAIAFLRAALEPPEPPQAVGRHCTGPALLPPSPDELPADSPDPLAVFTGG